LPLLYYETDRLDEAVSEAKLALNLIDKIDRTQLNIEKHQFNSADEIEEMLEAIIDSESKGRNKFGRENWIRISSNISKDLENFRNNWFNICVDFLKDAKDKIENDETLIINKLGDTSKIEIINDVIDGEAELSIKAYQLYLASGFLAQHEYISKSEGRDFADLLYAQVCGTQIDKCLKFIEGTKR
jgi:hypothetical protein